MLDNGTHYARTMHIVALLVFVLGPLLAAHGDVAKGVAERREFLPHTRGNINHYADKIAECGFERRAVHRWANLGKRMAKRSGVRSRFPRPYPLSWCFVHENSVN